MDVRGLAECLQEFSLKAGIAKDADFEGISPLDIVASYCVSLSGGRIVEERDIIARVNGCTSIDHFLRSVSRGTIPVATLAQIEAVQAGTLDEYKPEPPKPTKQQLVAAECRKELKKRKRSDWREFYGDSANSERELEQAIKRIDALDDHRATREFVQQHGSQLYQSVDHLGLLGTIERCKTPEEFIKVVTTKPDHSGRPRYNYQTGEPIR